MTLDQVWTGLPWLPDRREIWEWAEDNIVLPPAYTQSGPFSISSSRHFIGPLKALKDDLVREVNILASPRGGKTLIADLMIPYTLANDPGPVLFVFAVDGQAMLHCETRLMPILDACKPLQDIMPSDRHKKRTNQIQFANGIPLHVSGPATGNLQARGYRYLVTDEIWHWPPGKLREAKSRMGDFERLKTNKGLFISQGGRGRPGDEDADQWSQQYFSGIIHEWHVPCLSCGLMQPATWSGQRDDGTRYGIVWDEHKRQDGTHVVEASARTARFLCKFCGHTHQNTSLTRGKWNSGGDYKVVSDSGDPKVHSFHWNSIITDDWSNLVSVWLNARNLARVGQYTETIQFRQKQLAEFASERSIMETENPISRIEMSADAEWPDEKYRFMSVDVQQDHVWVMARAWAVNGESRRLHWGKLAGFDEVESLREKLGIFPGAVMVDAGYNTPVVYAHAANRGWTCSRGWDRNQGFAHRVRKGNVDVTVMKPWGQRQFGDPDAGIARDKGKKANLFPLAVPMLADRLQAIIDLGLWKDPKVDAANEDEREYNRQMQAEIKAWKPTQDGGKVVYWKQIRSDNHALDCARIQVAMAWMAGCL